MSFSDAAAGESGNGLNADWRNITGYKTTSGTAAAKKKTAASNETVYAFYDALGDNNIYCIQVFDQTKVKDADNDMIYMTENLSYDATVNSSIATEIGKMLNAFRKYRSITPYYLNENLARCAQDYCGTITADKRASRNADSLLDILFENYNVDPWNWGEACYTDAADAISFANSLIELDDFYEILVNKKQVLDPDTGGKITPTWSYAGVGMASNGKHTYVTVDYVDAVS